MMRGIFSPGLATSADGLYERREMNSPSRDVV